MHANRKQQKGERKALSTSLCASILFVTIEFIVSIITGSQAVLLDSIYDGVELVMILISMSIIPLLYQPSSEKHPYGYLQVESLFIVIKGFMMASVTLGLIMTNIELVRKGGHHVAFGIIAWFELFAFFLSMTVILLLKKQNKKANSPLVQIEIQEWSIDCVASLGMAVAFFLPIILPFHWVKTLSPYLDQVVAIVLSLFILPGPIKSILTGLRDLFLLAPEEETVIRIKEIINPILYVHGYTNLYYDIVRTGRKLWISVYITFDKDMVSISKFSKLQETIIEHLKLCYHDFYFELLPDIAYDTTTASEKAEVEAAISSENTAQ